MWISCLELLSAQLAGCRVVRGVFGSFRLHNNETLGTSSG